MTDDQLLKVFLTRAEKTGKSHNARLKNPRVVLTQQYGKKLYFALMFEGSIPFWWISFTKNGKKQVFILPELPDRLMDWKHDVIRKLINNSFTNYMDFDICKAPKEIVHIFFSAIISALNTPGMSIGLMGTTSEEMFGPNETYEEVQIEADLMGFSDDNC